MRCLYEIKDTITGQILEHSVTVGEVAKKLCPDKCNIMDGYEYAEECEEYETD